VQPTKAIGIDFGTTNSSVALADEHGAVQLADFAHSQSSRSLLYLQQRAALPGRPVSVWTGAPAISHYLATDSFDTDVRGRLIQSLKSHLSARNLTGTEIFGRQYRLEDLVAKLLTDLRHRASEVFGFEVTRAVAGRPVNFVGANNEADNDFALARLKKSFHQAGFTEVTFIMEPVAAAYAYKSTLDRDETLLIGDFGGGTTDFSLIRSGLSGIHDVLGNTGVGIAGDALDARIVRRLISPALGSDSLARSLETTMPAVPAWVYANLERWHTLSFLRTRATLDMLRGLHKRALEPDKIAALVDVIEYDLGYRLHQSVQRAKIDLSASETAEFVLDTDLAHLRAPLTRADFEQWISPELRRMESSLDELLITTNIPAENVDRVFLTGGSSLVPAVRRIFTARFGEDRVQSGAPFTSVAHGLALIAQSR
jgi:hypothetical chaperone protein